MSFQFIILKGDIQIPANIENYMYGEKKESNSTRNFLTLSHFIILIIVFYVLYPEFLNLNIRAYILFSFSIIFFIRLLITEFYLLNRSIKWGEAIGILFALILNQVGFTILSLNSKQNLDLFDYFGVFLFLLGSFINTFSELQRKKFKDKPENKGKLYTKGLFRYSMHINYFGDILWSFGWAILSHSPWAFIISLFTTANFIFFMVPMLQKYLKNKYKESFVEWEMKTKKLIPYIY